MTRTDASLGDWPYGQATRLNPPEDAEKIAAEAALRRGAVERQREQEMNLFSLALGHQLGTGAYSRVRFAKLIAKDIPQSLWPQMAVKIQDKEVRCARARATVRAYSFATEA